MNAITLIAGTWDMDGGKPSKIANLINSGIIKSGIFEETYEIRGINSIAAFMEKPAATYDITSQN